MKKFLIFLAIAAVVVVGGFLFITASAQRSAAATFEALETEAVRQDVLSSVVGGTGTVRAHQSAYLFWKAPGRVAYVAPAAGDQVLAGETIAEIAETSLPAYLILAEAELISYEKQLETLFTSQVLQAQAKAAVEAAEDAIEDALNPVMAQAEAQTAIAAAEEDLSKAETQLAIINQTVSQASIDQAYANMLLAENKLNKTLESIEQIENKKRKLSSLPLPQEKRRELSKGLNKALEGLEFQRSQEQLSYDRAVNKYNNLLAPPDPLDLLVAEAAVFAAQAQLDDALLQYDRIKDGTNPAEMAVLEAKLADAQREYERVKDGPHPDDILILETQIAAAEATLEQVRITAPFDGMVTQIESQAGDQVDIGTLAFRLDDLSTIYVDVEISEIDINLVEAGQEVVMTFDGIVATEYHGEVVEIAPVATISRGVTTYKVTVRLDDADEAVRPGMTAAVDIVTSQVEDVLLIPNRAIRLLDDERVVYLLKEITPEMITPEAENNGLPLMIKPEGPQQMLVPVQITLGASSDLYSEVVSGDLVVGDLVVLNPEMEGPSQGGGGISIRMHP